MSSFFRTTQSLILFVACNQTKKDNPETEQNDTIITTEIKQNTTEYVFDFAFVSSNTYIILDTVLNKNWAVGDAFAPVFYRKNRFTSIKNVDLNKIPECYKKMIGQTVKLAANNGEIFEVKVSSLKTMAECIPHFGTVQAWENTTVDEQANEIWSMEKLFLVAEFILE